MANIKNATLKLWIYTGTIGDKPEEPNYVLYKEVKTGGTVITFEIAELVKDYIDIKFEGIYGEITQTAWVEWELTKVFDDDSVVVETNQVVASSGYGYFEDKINPVEVLERGALISNEIIYTVKGQVVPFIGQIDASLTTITADNTVYTSDNNGKALPDVTNTYIPFLSTENGAFKADFYNGNNLIYTKYFGQNVTGITVDSTIYTADSTLLTADTTNIAGGESKIIEYVNIPKGTDKIIVVTAKNEVEVKKVVAIDECKYKPYKVSFINKFGAVQDLWFFKARKESARITKDTYTEGILEESQTGVFYSTARASRIPHKFNVQKSITLNTGFINEEYNEVIQQLLLTERAWVHEDDTVFPIIPKTQNLDYKSSLNDGLINYTVEFDYAYNEINLIK